LKGDKSQLDKLAGQRVTVKGKVDGTTITVELDLGCQVVEAISTNLDSAAAANAAAESA
jgi:hypothetical protein